MCNLVFIDADGNPTDTRFPLATLTSSFKRKTKILTLGPDAAGKMVIYDLKAGNIGFKRVGDALLVGKAAFVGCPSVNILRKYVGLTKKYTKFELTRLGGGIGISDLRDPYSIVVEHHFDLDACPILVDYNAAMPSQLEMEFLCNVNCGTPQHTNTGHQVVERPTP